MGVTGLWPILAPVKKRQPLSSLQGQTLAVDLSIWVCENQNVRQMQNKVHKPHLRNLFFRISTLLHLGVNLVFVVEGQAPALKHEEMGRRMQARNKGMLVKEASSSRKFNRGRFHCLLKECCELLDALGVPYIQSQGEAEATCAALNAAGVVDGCVSDDGDCFLYGATVVHRNLSVDSKDPFVESFNMVDITSELHLTRERLVALALLLGCDYCPAGVPGVGEARAIKLMASLATVDVLQRFQQWSTMMASDCVDATEAFVWRKANALPNFPPNKVVEEFLQPKDTVPPEPPVWKRPCILRLMIVGSRYLQWPEEYSLQKVLPLTTLWDQLRAMNPSLPVHTASLLPCRIVKRRVRQGVACWEVEWHNNIKGLVDETGQPRPLVTLESAERFQACYPAVVESFTQHEEQMKAAKPKRNKKPKVKTATDMLANQLDALTIDCEDFRSESSDGTRVQTPSDCNASTEAGCRALQQEAENPGSKASSSHHHCRTRTDQKSTTGCFSQEGDESVEIFSSALDSVVRTVKAEQPLCKTHNAEESPGTKSFLNRSVEYVPLSQRLSILADSEDKQKEHCGVINLDDSYTYIPLSQRLKIRLGCADAKTSSSSLLSVESESSSSKVKLPLCVRDKPSSCSSLSQEQGNRLKTSVLSVTQSHSVPSAGTDVFLKLTADTHDREKREPQSQTMVSMADSIHRTAECLTFTKAVSDGACTVQTLSNITHSFKKSSAISDIKQSAASGCHKLKASNSRKEGRELKQCSQTHAKASILAGLLEDWSDEDSGESGDDDDRVSLSVSQHTAVNLSVKMSDESLNLPHCDTQHSSVPVICQQQVDCGQSWLSEDQSCHTTPADGCPQAQDSGDSRISLSAASFVSDGHFTLHHSLFTSMDNSDLSGVGACSSDLSLPPCNTPAVSSRATQSSADREPPQLFEAMSSLSPSLAQTADMSTVGSVLVAEKLLCDGDPPLSPVSTSASLEPGTVEAGSVNDRLKLVEELCPSEDRLSASVLSAGQHLSSQSTEADQNPSEEKTFLSLSQRLRLKKPSSKALNDLINR